MSDLELFKGNPLVNSDIFKSLMDINDKLAGGGGSVPRISIRGSRFRLIVGGEQVSVMKGSSMEMIVVDAAPIARTYYEGDYDPEKTTAPKCWSTDTRAPSPEVPEEDRMAARCADCPMNIKGSGQGESRACRFSQRLAVALPEELDTVYQMQLPATSLFGEAKGNDMGMQAYVKFLQAHRTPVVAVMTEARFDDDATAPKLYFSPKRALTEDELKSVLELREHEDTARAITMTVSQTDKVEKGEEKEPAKAKAKPKPKVEDDEDEAPKAKKTTAKKAPVEDEDEIEEPKKVTAASKKAVVDEDEDEGEDKLASLLSDWDD